MPELPEKDDSQELRDKSQWRLLVVDDEEYLRDLYVDMLRDDGYIVDEAENGEVALLMLQNDGHSPPYHLVISDVNMPKMDGLELSRIIGEEYSETEVLILTAVGDKRTVIELFRNGICEYLDKPVEICDLLGMVESILRGDRRRGAVGQLQKLKSELEQLIASGVREQNEQVIAWIRGGVKHRFNQPLTVLFSNIELLEYLMEKIDVEERFLSPVSESLESVRDAAVCVQQLLKMLAQMQTFESMAYVGEERILDFERSKETG